MVVHLDVDESQYLLFEGGAELLTIEEDERKGKYSGKIIDQNRQKVRAICAALAEGIGVNRIAKAFSVSIHTVLALRDRHPELIAAEEKMLSAQISRVLKVGVDRYLQALVDGVIPAAQLPVGLGILFDKKQLLDGKPTTISSSQKQVATFEEMKRALEALPIDVEVISETQSGGQDGK